MITKHPTDKSNYAANLRFTRNARTAWEYILRSASKEQKPRVLLPAYIGFTDREGSGVFDPVIATSSDYTFYPITDDLRVDVAHFEASLSEVTIALVIHYFGFCRNDMQHLKSLCERYNVTLVEDCAHAFHGGLRGKSLGHHGTFSFYSIHKYLPASTGGVLQINSAKSDFAPISNVDSAPLSVLEQYAMSDLDGIATRRRDNYRTYLLMLPRHEILEVMYELEEHDIPQSFPLKIKNGIRPKLYFHLMAKNMPTTALYYRLISQIAKETFPLSYKISDEILNLPVHQDITREDICRLCGEIKAFLDENA